MPDISLYYFDAVGFGEAVRLAFHIGGVPFEDVRFSRDQWVNEFKAKAPSGKCPWLEFKDGGFITESKAILVYAAGRSGLVPFDLLELAVCEQAYNVALDAYSVMRCLIHDRGDREENLKDLRTRLLAADKVLGSRQSKGEAWVNGKSMTYADLGIFGFFKNAVDRLPDTNVQQYTHLYQVYEAVLHHPRVKDYYASRTQ
ncbi:putative glutathione S-transferase [Gregarina niphandrodes]|uniref:Glutathione S-transferase n=1 Tax=Gregarina niphandrodes TaxID=110365 RepID=A0A023B8K0_GRENI|nr:putative glutathione S-transferase [Gregarina niphandrodes]EZG69097.1 putative glutathione S-transferase [Gregarina niphandrodes]|eukprot:XP_011134502.1 putative glutathione S-transferase [Gregarina niphandrodes]